MRACTTLSTAAHGAVVLSDEKLSICQQHDGVRVAALRRRLEIPLIFLHGGVFRRGLDSYVVRIGGHIRIAFCTRGVDGRRSQRGRKSICSEIDTILQNFAS